MIDHIDFAIFIDLKTRDGEICNLISKELNRIGYSSKCFPLREEKYVYKSFNVSVSVINKPHFFMFHRLMQKIRGTKFIVLDTEGILPGENRQHVLLEPEAYIHWFKHQANRYKFKFTNVIVSGYPRKYFLYDVLRKKIGLVTVATNFSILGYSKIEVKNKKKDRKLKLTNDWDLFQYRSFQESSLDILIKILSSNSDKQFVLKPHPNDPKSLWDEISLPNNVTIFQGEKTISELFKLNPEMHLCMDGCTTILDAYLSNIPVVTFGKFAPLKHSLLRNLVAHELGEHSVYSLENAKPQLFKPKIKNRLLKTQELEEFRTELDNFDLTKIILVAEKVYRDKAKFCLYDVPTVHHFMFWIKNFLKKLMKFRREHSDRIKFSR